MPANFPEVWLDRVIENISNADQAPWLEGIAELDADVSALNEGAENEQNIIYVATTDFDVDVLINNTTYPIAVQEYTDGTLSFQLDKYQTKVVSLNDDKVIGSSYDVIDKATGRTVKSLTKTKYAKALHSIAPFENTGNTPVLVATGGPDQLHDSSDRLRLTYEDLVEARRACRAAGFPEDDIRIVLCNEHWSDLLLDRKNFGNQLVDYAKGKPAPVVAGFEIFPPYAVMPKYSSANAKKAWGAVAVTGDQEASIIFSKEGVAKKTGLTKQYFLAAKDNPTGQANQLAYRHYFLCVPFRAKLVGAIVSGTYVAPEE